MSVLMMNANPSRSTASQLRKLFSEHGSHSKRSTFPAILPGSVSARTSPSSAFNTTHGFKGLLNGAYDYTNLLARVQQRVQVGALGFFRYTPSTGKSLGTLPYPLLIIHAGNETFCNTKASFNTMNFFEFMSDRRVSGELIITSMAYSYNLYRSSAS